MNLNLIGRYRTQLMGIAIIWVVLFHSNLNSFPLHIFNQIKYMGYMGVDIFMFLSGYGIYNSINKNTDIKTFYKKRILRILPYYLPIVTIFSIFLYEHKIISIKIIILNIFTISYWLGLNSFDWYIPTILLFYLLSPFYIRLFNHNKNRALIISYCISAILFILLIGSKYSYLYGTVVRWPIYISGIWFGHYFKLKTERKLSKYYIFLFIILVLVGFFVWNRLFLVWGNSSQWNTSGISLIPNLIMSIPLTFLLSYILSLFKNYKYPILTFLGSYTLTLYIFQERIIEVLKFYHIPFLQKSSSILIVTLFFAVIWQKTVDKILAKYFH